MTHAKTRDNIPHAIDSAGQGGNNVARRKFQRGSVIQNKSKTAWVGTFSNYILDSNGAVRRKREWVNLGLVRKLDGSVMTKREARRILQPYVDRVNASISAPAREIKRATLEEFSKVWERDYLRLYKDSTQPTVRGQVRSLVSEFGNKDMRQIDASDLQRVIAQMMTEGYDPKTIRNLSATVSLIWKAAVAQKYVDVLLPKPKLPRSFRKKPRYFRLEDVGKIIAHLEGGLLVFCYLAAETGLRAGELCGLRLIDVESDRLTVNQTVWHGRIQATPKTGSSVRTLALSRKLGALLHEQMERQRTKGHTLLFSTRSGKPWDAGLLVRRKLQPLLLRRGVLKAGLHAFRHFNASLLSSLRVPLKTIQERLGHAATGSLTLDVYTHSEWSQNTKAARLAGKAIEKAAHSGSLSVVQKKRASGSGPGSPLGATA